jgi:hypothetical protein
MNLTSKCICAASLLLAAAASCLTVAGRSVAAASNEPSPPAQALAAPQPLFDFQSSDIKFRLETLMNVLLDRRHEGWVLAAYPDPKTGRPLIGAGFGLEVEATAHPQRDPLNPHMFLEPSSAQLWQAAGLDEERLEKILDQYDRDLAKWKKKNFRKKAKTSRLTPQLTEAEARRLLQVSAIQAVHNAQAYCRDFDQLTASQQMALSQLVFQMGVNLEEFAQFLATLNREPGYFETVELADSAAGDSEYWSAVQLTLIQSDWARRYRTRAVSVIAMFDPDYAESPSKAERKVEAVLRPPPKHHHKKTHTKAA